MDVKLMCQSVGVALTPAAGVSHWDKFENSGH
jgi:hypothetical protein